MRLRAIFVLNATLGMGLLGCGDNERSEPQDPTTDPADPPVAVGPEQPIGGNGHEPTTRWFTQHGSTYGAEGAAHAATFNQGWMWIEGRGPTGECALPFGITTE